MNDFKDWIFENGEDGDIIVRHKDGSFVIVSADYYAIGGVILYRLVKDLMVSENKL